MENLNSRFWKINNFGTDYKLNNILTVKDWQSDIINTAIFVVILQFDCIIIYL